MSTGNEPERNDNVEVFVISPIGQRGSPEHDRSNKVLKHIIRKALPEPNYVVRRADEEMHSDSITPRITRRIVEAGLIVVDLTGHNPNVMYEVAIAHSFAKPVVHIIGDGEDPPFDMKDMRTISYDIRDLDSVERAVDGVSAAATAALSDPNELVTPVTALGRFADLSRSAGSAGDGSAIAAAMEELLGRMSHVERSLSRVLRQIPSSRQIGSPSSPKSPVDMMVRLEEMLELLNTKTDTLTPFEFNSVLHETIQMLNHAPAPERQRLHDLLLAVDKAEQMSHRPHEGPESSSPS